MQLHCAVIPSRVQTVSAIGFKGEVTEFRLVKFWLCYEICGENLSKDLTNMGPRGGGHRFIQTPHCLLETKWQICLCFNIFNSLDISLCNWSSFQSRQVVLHKC